MNRLLIFLLLLPVITYAQQKKNEIRHIEVWGQAEKMIVPNEIYTSITIKEYKAPNKKVTLDDLEKQLVKAVAAEKIPKENLRVENIHGYNWDWKRQRSDEFLASKTFTLKTEDIKKLNDLLSRIDSEGLNQVHVKRYTHSDLENIERELQLEALKDAKAKAKNLLNGIDEVLGGVLEIQEIQHSPYYPERMEMMSRARGAADDQYESDVEFKNIKVTASIRAVFEIN